MATYRNSGSGDPSPSRRDSDDWLAQIGQTVPEVLLPGYWENIGNNSATWANEVSAGPFWQTAHAQLDLWRQEDRSEHASDLLSEVGLPKFVGKSAASIKDKVCRKCKDPEFASVAVDSKGPPVPKISDLVRTRIACRYIDGVEFLASKLCKVAEEMGLGPRRERQGKVEGYFAQHITINQDVIYRIAGVSRQTKVLCEIQLATDFGTRMWDASHSLYERVRGKASTAESWQWTPEDPRFIANQLGHMIHLADGLLMHLRNSGSPSKDSK